MLARLKFEISGLVKEILNQVDPAVFQSHDKTFLDPAMGGGQFIFETIKRLKEQGHSYDSIKTRVFGFESSIVYVNYVKERYLREFGEEIPATLRVGGLDELEALKMRFDLVMGNPPYQDATKKGSYNAIWQKFILKGFSILTASGQAVFISPQTWFTQSRINSGNEIAKVQKIIFDYADVINTKDVNHFFPGIGSSFSYYVISKVPNRECLINGKVSSRKLIHQTLMDFGDLLIEKLLSFPLFDRASDASSKGTVSDSSSTTHIFPVLTSQKRNDWTDKKSRYHNIPKAIFLVRTSYNFPVIDDKGDLSPPPGSVSSTYLLPDPRQRQIFRGLFDSKLFRFLIGGQRKHHGFLSMRTVASLPYVDLSRIWTDQELYAHFGLTEEEIRYIEEQMK